MLRALRLSIIPLAAVLSLSVSAQEAEPVAEPTSATTDETGEAGTATDSAEGSAQFLFVQGAHSIAYAEGTLTLEQVGPTTLFFSDRPERIAGHMTTAEFVVFWSENDEDSFAVNPPNATLSILGEDLIEDVVVELTNPVLEGDRLSYDVAVLEGELPPTGGTSSLFIDPVGMPLTPMSYAGVARRSYRRRVY